MSETSTTSIRAVDSSIPHLPRLGESDEGAYPKSPINIAATGVDRATLSQLALKTACGVPHFSGDWMAQRLQLPQALIMDLLEELRNDTFLETKGEGGDGYRYAITGRGREQARHYMDVSGYVGPAPVSLEAYTAFLGWQMARTPVITPEQVMQSLSSLVLSQEALDILGLACASGRSLFLFGPPGNGKTSVSRKLHEVEKGDIWIPHCIVADGTIIRLYDPHCHIASPLQTQQSVDNRWMRIKRPLIVVGGEMTLEALDLAYNPSLRVYEAPLHLKANGGTFLIDDFGRQRVAPTDLLNRWIVPLENHIDYLTLTTGQKLEVPFQLMLIFATNLAPEDVTDPAFLRRIGYRLCIGGPDEGMYRSIFTRYAASLGMALEPALLDDVLNRYRATGKELRSCEPRDILERVKDICTYRRAPLALTPELLDLAWKGYFGDGKTAA